MSALCKDALLAVSGWTSTTVPVYMMHALAMHTQEYHTAACRAACVHYPQQLSYVLLCDTPPTADTPRAAKLGRALDHTAACVQLASSCAGTLQHRSSMPQARTGVPQNWPRRSACATRTLRNPALHRQDSATSLSSCLLSHRALESAACTVHARLSCLLLSAGCTPCWP